MADRFEAACCCCFTRAPSMCSTHKDRINADLLAFFKGEKPSVSANVV